jgi:hypothetical protein
VGAPDLLVWDAGNREHLAERNARRVAAGQAPISEQECDDLFLSGDWVWEEVEHRTRDGPWVWQRHITGPTPEGRFLTLACDYGPWTGYRPATVWPSSPAEIERYLRSARDAGEGDGQ